MKKVLKNIIQRWKTNLGIRLSVFIMSVTILLFAATLVTCMIVTENELKTKIIEKTNNQMADALEIINLNLVDVAESTTQYASVAKYFTSTKEGCYELCQKLLENDPDIYAVTILFCPDYFKDMPAGHHLFAPCVTRNDNGKGFVRSNLTEISDSSYNYIKYDGIWQKTIESRKGYWEEPYSDSHNPKNNFLETFSYPLCDDNGKIYAVICSDIQLKWIEQLMKRLKPTEHAQIAITTSKGNYLVHHIPEFIGIHDAKTNKKNIDSLYEEGKINTEWIEIHDKLEHGEQGMATISEKTCFTMAGRTDTVYPGFIIYAPIKETGWTASAACPKSDITAQANVFLDKILLCSVIGLVIMAVALYYMVRKIIAPFRKFAAVHSDINTAAKIQMAMVPKTFPEPEEINGTDIFGSMKPARSVGGDLYDFVLNGDILTFIIGDVSGKGIPAALFMAGARTLFRVVAHQYDNPADILVHINDSMSENNDMNMFVTMFICKLNIKTGHIDFCNGGHNRPVVIHKDKASFLEAETNLPIGVMGGIPFVNEAIDLEKGDKLLLYTDGVTEAEDINGNLYGDDHLLEFLSANVFCSSRDLCTRLAENVSVHARNAEQSDDITMMCVGL